MCLAPYLLSWATMEVQALSWQHRDGWTTATPPATSTTRRPPKRQKIRIQQTQPSSRHRTDIRLTRPSSSLTTRTSHQKRTPTSENRPKLLSTSRCMCSQIRRSTPLESVVQLSAGKGLMEAMELRRCLMDRSGLGTKIKATLCSKTSKFRIIQRASSKPTWCSIPNRCQMKAC